MDRERGKIIDFQVTKSRDFSEYYKLATRIEESYKVNHLCTDAYEVYSKYRISKHHHQTKAETALVESKNSLIRHYLARSHRKTKRYSKAFDMIENSLMLLFFRDLLSSFVI